MTYAQEAYAVATELQNYFVKGLNHLSETLGENQNFKAVEWLRNHGKNGGGLRYEAEDDSIFNRASVNISHVHYNNDSSKTLGSASAISTIIHPRNPHVPSMHMHISWTEMKDEKGYWRMMADLNPSISNEKEKEKFSKMLQEIEPTLYEEGSQQGDKYFYIPALQRHRGVSHYYLEDYYTHDAQADKLLAQRFGKDVIDCYIEIINEAIKRAPRATPEDLEKQLSYHSLYLFQVLTLDRGTTSGLLIHDQNDVGIMGSIPSHVNRELLTVWIENMQTPQDELLRKIIEVLPKEVPSFVNEEIKKILASVVREHYKKYPEALNLQASGNVIPPTVKNHQE